MTTRKPQKCSEAYEREIKEIKAARLFNGFVPIKIGKRICLKCDNVFESEDLKNQKICNPCRLINERY